MNPTMDYRIPVGILDTGLNIYDPRFRDVLCHGGHQDFTGEGLSDRIGHGTHVAGIVMNGALAYDKYCLVIIKVVGNKVEALTQGIQYARRLNLAVINISISGTEFYPDEKQALMAVPNTKVVVAAGNHNKPYTTEYPAGYGLPNVSVVGNWDCKNQKKGLLSNYGDSIIWRCGTNIVSTLPYGKFGAMSGTSMAAPMYTAELINQLTSEGK